MMVEYFLRLALLLPLMAALIWGSLKLSRYLQSRLSTSGERGRTMQLVETSLLAPGMRLAVVRFHDREILVGCTRQGMVRLSETDSRDGVDAEEASSTDARASGKTP